MLRNKKGLHWVPPMAMFVYGAAAIIGYTVTSATVETAKNGTLKNNGKVIWCKMQNKGEQFCNEKYGYVPSK